MKRIKAHISRWNTWRKSNNNSCLHHILVLFGIVKSPSFETMSEVTDKDREPFTSHPRTFLDDFEDYLCSIEKDGYIFRYSSLDRTEEIGIFIQSTKFDGIRITRRISYGEVIKCDTDEQFFGMLKKNVEEMLEELKKQEEEIRRKS